MLKLLHQEILHLDERISNMSFLKRALDIIKSNFYSDKHFYKTFDGLEEENHIEYDFQNKSKNSSSTNLKHNSLEAEYYANLELAYGASFSEIKTAYRKLLKKYHPDRFYNDEKKLQLAQEVVTKLNLAYNYFENKFTGS